MKGVITYKELDAISNEDDDQYEWFDNFNMKKLVQVSDITKSLQRRCNFEWYSQLDWNGIRF